MKTIGNFNPALVKYEGIVVRGEIPPRQLSTDDTASDYRDSFLVASFPVTFVVGVVFIFIIVLLNLFVLHSLNIGYY